MQKFNNINSQIYSTASRFNILSHHMCIYILAALQELLCLIPKHVWMIKREHSDHDKLVASVHMYVDVDCYLIDMH